MRTVHEVSELAGVSVRTLQHYDRIGLLHPTARTAAGWRLYSDEDLARLQQILLFRELEFPLKEIKRIVTSPGFDQTRALERQIRLLELKREHLDKVIALAKELKAKGVEHVSTPSFDTSLLDEYARQAKESWGDTAAWQEFERKDQGRTMEDTKTLGTDLLTLFVPLGQMAAAGSDPSSAEAQEQVAKIQAFITEHYYHCTDEIFAQLGRAYGAGGEFTANIDAVAGTGAGAFAARAIALRSAEARRS